MRTRLFGLLIIGAALLLPGSPAVAHTPQYRFRIIEDSANGWEPFFGCAALNNAGQVAFNGSRADTFAQVIVRSDGRERVVITRDRGQYDFLGVN